MGLGEKSRCEYWEKNAKLKTRVHSYTVNPSTLNKKTQNKPTQKPTSMNSWCTKFLNMRPIWLNILFTWPPLPVCCLPVILLVAYLGFWAWNMSAQQSYFWLCESNFCPFNSCIAHLPGSVGLRGIFEHNLKILAGWECWKAESAVTVL